MNAQRRPRKGLDIVQESFRVEASLWRRFYLENALECREILFDRYHPIARYMARKEYGKRPGYGLECADFEQLAFEGLLYAISAYDPLKNVPFFAFARFRIRGAITDGISRSSERAAQYNYTQRQMRSRLRSISEVRATDQAEQPSLEKLAERAVGLALGLILEEASALDAVCDNSRQSNVYETVAWRDLLRRARTEVGQLSSQYQTVVRQHYFNGVPFKQIAILMGLSAGRVSQIHQSAITELKKRLAGLI